MACFIVSSIAAIGVGAAKHIVRHYERKRESAPIEQPKEYRFGSQTKWSKKLAYLELTLWGGSFLLAGEHILHGEVTPFPPFLTAMNNPDDMAEMFMEMGTVGVAMLLALVVAWAVGVFIWDCVCYRRQTKAKGVERI